MKDHPGYWQRLRLWHKTGGLFAILTATWVGAAAPQWWQDRGVLDVGQQTNDFAAANIGQLKHMAAMAAEEMDAELPGGAGEDIEALVTSFSATNPQKNDFAGVNVGQLKAVAKPFYERLIQVGYADSFPWSDTDPTRNDYAAVNIGQLKNIFSFDVGKDEDEDGLRDWWEMLHFGDLLQIASGDPDNDSLTNENEYAWETDPIAGDNPFPSWQSSQFPEDAGNYPVIHAEADPDEDGITNLYEYVFVTDPNEDDADVGEPVFSTINDHPSLTFRRRKVMPDYAVVLQSSSDGIAWITISPLVVSTTDHGLYDELTWSDASVQMSVVGTHHLRVLALPVSGVSNLLFQPKNLKSELLTSSTAKLTWDDLSPSETGYQIERRTTDTGSWSTQTTTAADVTTWTDPSVPATSNVYYRVRARINTSSSSAYSNLAALVTPGDSDADGINDAEEITAGLDPLDWSDATGDLDGDGVPNRWELAMGTSMTNAGDRPAATITVDPTFVSETSTQKKTIAAAISAALGNSTTPPYSIIEVKAGTYLEDITLPSNKRILLLAAAGNGEVPEIQGDGTATIVFNGESVVDGFRISHEQGTAGRGITVNLAADRSSARVVNCIIGGNATTSYGAGIYHVDGRLTVAHCTVTGNSAASGSNAIITDALAQTVLVNSICWNPSGESAEEVNASGGIQVRNSFVRDGSVAGSILDDPLLDRLAFVGMSSPVVGAGNATAAAPKDIHRETRTNPPDVGADHFVDSDSDSLADWWEIEYFGNLSLNGSGDGDSDGLTNVQEYQFGSDPTSADADGDGVNDGAEFAAGTDPWDADTDNDGMTDAYELSQELDPLDRRDGLEDKDGDRIPNLYEFARGTDANNASSVPSPDYTVDPAGGGTHTSIISAISSANSSGDYKIILVKSGVYETSNVSISSRPIMLMGEQGKRPPHLVATATNNILLISKENVVIDGLQLSHSANSDSAGRAVNISSMSAGEQVRLVNCIITDNSDDEGGGIRVSSGELTVDHCTIAFNSEEGSTGGHGIYLASAASLRLRNSIVWNPSTEAGPKQIYKAASAICEVTDSIVLSGEHGGLIDDPLLDRYCGLLPNSPAIKRLGVDAIQSPSKDIHGETRSAPPDLGADEFVDSDSDELPDRWELVYYPNLSNDGESDTDSDSLENYYEYLLGFDPTNADTLGLGEGDEFEAVYDTEDAWYPAEWSSDEDEDDLNAAMETRFVGSDPELWDTNGDGLSDLQAYLLGISPTSNDVDGDGLLNMDELLFGVNPLISDTDGDGVSDYLDRYPGDPSESVWPAVNPSDTTPPVITITLPAGAVLLP